MHQLHISSGASGWRQASAAAILLVCALALEAKEVERTEEKRRGSVVVQVGGKQETRKSGTAAQKRVSIDAKFSEAFGNLVVLLMRKKSSYTAEVNAELL